MDLDFNRIVISESGETLVLVDRKSPYIIMIKNVLEMDPLPLILHTPASGIQSPLQAACFPICPQEFPVWDSSLPQIPGLTQSAVTEINRSLEVCPELCFAAAGSNLWIIPIREDLAIDLPTELPPRDSSPSKDSDDEAAIDSTHSPYHLYLDQLRSSESITRHLVDLSKFRDPFLIHDVISITSSVLLILNRHRDNTGLYQLSTSDWGNTTSSYSLKYLIGKDYVAPHGMTISLDRKQILIVESGSKETSGQSGGYINIMNIHLCESKKSIRISDSRKLQESGNEIKNWENKLKIPVYPQVPLPYDQVYDMDGEEFLKQEENQYHEYTSNCLMS